MIYGLLRRKTIDSKKTNSRACTQMCAFYLKPQHESVKKNIKRPQRERVLITFDGLGYENRKCTMIHGIIHRMEQVYL